MPNFDTARSSMAYEHVNKTSKFYQIGDMFTIQISDRYILRATGLASFYESSYQLLRKCLGPRSRRSRCPEIGPFHHFAQSVPSTRLDCFLVLNEPQLARLHSTWASLRIDLVEFRVGIRSGFDGKARVNSLCIQEDGVGRVYCPTSRQRDGCLSRRRIWRF